MYRRRCTACAVVCLRGGVSGLRFRLRVVQKLLLTLTLGATVTTGMAVTPLWMRDVRISPDGTEILFCYKGTTDSATIYYRLVPDDDINRPGDYKGNVNFSVLID